MNGVQKLFMLGWCPCAVFMILNCVAHIGKTPFGRATTIIEAGIFPTIAVTILTITLYYLLRDRKEDKEVNQKG